METIFDLETNGLLKTVSKVHCVGLLDPLDSVGEIFTNQEEGYRCLEEALGILKHQTEILIGHNIIGYDLPVLKKLFDWVPRKSTKIVDTLVLSKLAFPDMYEQDKKEKLIPVDLWGKHSLESWGYRFKSYKGDYGKQEGAWETFSTAMADYCIQDLSVTNLLYALLRSKGLSAEAVHIETEFATIMQRQMERGFKFDVQAGQELYVKLLKRQQELHAILEEAFGVIYINQGLFTPKRDNATKGYTKGAQLTKIKSVPFNPNSRDHIAAKLTKTYNWKPKKFTPGGKPQIDEAVLSELKFPNCDVLNEHFLVSKRISQLAEGQAAWLKLEEKGRIYGNINPNGAVTGRCTHSSPNVANVPASYSPYGTECRALFSVDDGYMLVGCDADGLELRALAGYMRKWDKGAYAEAAISGDKNLGTDIHSLNMKALGITDRDMAKTWFYAFIYGAGDGKLGSILGKGMAAGKKSRADFLSNIEALGLLTDAVQKNLDLRGYLIGLDGRKLHVRSSHAALNTLLQSAGAILMKKALIILDKKLQSLGYKEGDDYEFVGNIHDEFQMEVKPNHVKAIAAEAEDSIKKAGEYFEFGCPLSATAKVGKSWAETH